MGREGLDAELGTRFTLGRTRDAVSAEGGDRLCAELARASWAHAGLAQRCKPLDTTRCALTGASGPDRDEHARRLPPGDSKAHWPDLKPAVVARMVSHAGGVPGGRPRWDGNTSDPRVCPARAEAFMRAFTDTPSPHDRVAEAHRDGEANAAHLAPRGLIPRMPAAPSRGGRRS